MSTLLYLIGAICLSFASWCDAHTYLSSINVNNQVRPDCTRPVGTNSPVMPLNSPNQWCGFLPNADNPSQAKCAVKAGSRIGVQWNWESTAPSDMIIASSHKGPCLVYLSQDTVSWFKIYEFGYDNVSNQFCVTKLIADKGLLMFNLPSDIASGNYLLRAEIIALHEAYNAGGAQPYVGCAELTISGNGKANPAGVSFPGAYSATDPGIFYNIYASPLAPYVVPGPAVYASSSSGGDGDGSGGGAASASGENDDGSSTNGTNQSAAIAVVVIVLIALVFIVIAPTIIYRKKGEIFGYTFQNGRFVSTKDKNLGSANINYVAFEDRDDL